MFDKIRGGIDNARDENFPVRKPHVFPHLPLMGMSWIRRFDRIRTRPYLQHEVNDVFERHIMRVRPFVIAPANIVADLVFRDIAKGVIEGFHPHLKRLPILV